MEEGTYKWGDWLLVIFVPPSPLGRVDLGGRDKGGHHRQPAPWPSASHQPVPAGESPAVLPSAILLCDWNTAELPADRWTPLTLNLFYMWYTDHIQHTSTCRKWALRRATCSNLCWCTSWLPVADVEHARLQEAVVPFNHLETPCGEAEVWRFACSNPCVADERKSVEEWESPPILFSQAQGKVSFPDIYSHLTRDKLKTKCFSVQKGLTVQV